VTVTEVVPGIHHWTSYHRPIGTRVSSYWIEPAGAIVDPHVPDDGLGELKSLGTAETVVLTSGHHLRDAPAFAEHYGVPVRCSPEAADHIGEQYSAQACPPGSEVAADVTLLDVGVIAPDEGALHVALDGGALILADGIQHDGDDLAFFDDELLGDDPEAVKTGLKRVYRGMLSREFDALLFAHGAPITDRARERLEQFVEQ
jgi:hypothetical protein